MDRCFEVCPLHAINKQEIKTKRMGRRHLLDVLERHAPQRRIPFLQRERERERERESERERARERVKEREKERDRESQCVSGCV